MKTKSNLLLLFLLFLVHGLCAQTEPYLNPALSFEERAADLVSRMTVEEKIEQMMHSSPAIKRLGIDEYNWWNECLHGVGRAGLATVFPQAIGLAATFDYDAVYNSASIISDEARAKHHDFARKGKHEIYQGLTFWTPNINIFRDPRWGRGQETYGEDPFLTGAIGEAFVKGLQGNDPKYLKLVATAKHYAVHSGPEYERHIFNALSPEYDLWDTYLPAFRRLIKNAGVYSVMCAYNRYYGEPCCGSNNLQNNILRNIWGFNGYIVSDCGAIDDIYKTHKFLPDAATSSALGVRSGTDLECGASYKALKKAYKDGMVTEKEIDVAVNRLFVARMKLGMFDNDIPYSKIPYSVVDSEKHRKQSLEMARKSIVLLKNDNNTLPLSKKIKTIAVVGPNAENKVSVLGNYNGTPSYIITPLQGIKNKLGKGCKVIYSKGITFTNDTVANYINIFSNISNGGNKGLKAEYFNNIKLEGKPVLVRNETNIDFTGDIETNIAPNIRARNISVRWTGDFVPAQTEKVSFEVIGDDGFRLFINDEKVIDKFTFHETMSDYYTLSAEAGKTYKIRLEYFQAEQGARIKFSGVNLVKTDMKALANELKIADAIIFVGGISPEIEGEEMPVNMDGFMKGDRTTIALPHVQTDLLKHLNETGKPVVFVMQTGSALAVKWEKENIPAIINTWYGGQDAGTALADVLFGDYNPAGRLPVTFYESDKDLPDYNDYSMSGRTYRYFNGKPLFAFGHGLSYTSFKYTNFNVPTSINAGDSLTVQVTVKNTGKINGDEVVQIYASFPDFKSKKPIRSLVAFKRVGINAGESKTVDFKICPRSLSIINTNAEREIVATDITLTAGGGQEGNTEVLTSKLKINGKSVLLDK